MSNLGWYQVMTTAAKKVGGVEKLFVLTLGAGGVLYKCSELLIKKAYRIAKGRINKSEDSKDYCVTSDGKFGKNLVLNVGDKYKILASDGDSVLIEKIGDDNNPYFVSANFLRTVSDFSE